MALENAKLKLLKVCLVTIMRYAMVLIFFQKLTLFFCYYHCFKRKTCMYFHLCNVFLDVHSITRLTFLANSLDQDRALQSHRMKVFLIFVCVIFLKKVILKKIRRPYF